jgi:hypothetical protein
MGGWVALCGWERNAKQRGRQRGECVGACLDRIHANPLDVSSDPAERESQTNQALSGGARVAPVVAEVHDCATATATATARAGTHMGDRRGASQMRVQHVKQLVEVGRAAREERKHAAEAKQTRGNRVAGAGVRAERGGQRARRRSKQETNRTATATDTATGTAIYATTGTGGERRNHGVRVKAEGVGRQLCVGGEAPQTQHGRVGRILLIAKVQHTKQNSHQNYDQNITIML